MDNALQQLVNAIKAVAPAVWEMTVRQVYLVALMDGIWGTIFLVGFFVLLKFSARWWVREADSFGFSSDHDVEKFMSVLGMVLLVVFALLEYSYVVSYLVNPNWYAVRFLLNAAGK